MFSVVSARWGKIQSAKPVGCKVDNAAGRVGVLHALSTANDLSLDLAAPIAPTQSTRTNDDSVGCSGQDANSGDKNGAKKGIFHGCLLRFSAGLVKNSPRSRQGKKASELLKKLVRWYSYGLFSGSTLINHSIIVSI